MPAVAMAEGGAARRFTAVDTVTDLATDIVPMRQGMLLAPTEAIMGPLLTAVIARHPIIRLIRSMVTVATRHPMAIKPTAHQFQLDTTLHPLTIATATIAVAVTDPHA